MGSINSIDELRLDDTLINEFRKTVNNSPRFKEVCTNLENKNKMNVIYSAMDWLNVGIEGTRNVDFSLKGMGYNHQNTLKVTQYIISVDLILESIKQIYRVVENRFNEKYPFNKTKHIFKAILSDDDYFKHLRAVFGIHPVNLTSIDGVEDEKNPKRFFASWVAYAFGGENDFEVSIYGNDVDYDSTDTFGINLALINKFVRERYELLNDLLKVVQDASMENKLKYEGVQINLKDEEELNNLKILFKENEKRFSKNEAYGFLLSYMIEVFENNSKCDLITFDNTVIEIYLKRLMGLIPQIKSKLENMIYEEIQIGILARGYEFEKIAQYLYNQKNEVGEEYFLGLVKHSDLPNEFRELKDFGLYRLVYDAFLYSKMGDKDFIIYKELLHEPNIYISTGSIGFTGYKL